MLAYSKSTLQHINGIDVIHLNEDTPFETGYAFGRLLMLSENAMAAFFRSRIVGVILRCLSFFSRRYLNRVELPDRYQAEIAGCAVATEIPYQNVLFLNVCFDLSKKIGWYCSTFTFFNDQKILVGRNTDFRPVIGRLLLKLSQPLVVGVKTPGCHRFFHVSFPLFMGVLNGFNSNGTVVNAHQITTRRDISRNPHLATPFLMRMVLEFADCQEDAAEIIRQNPVCRAINLMVTCENERNTCIYELLPDDFNQNLQVAGDTRFLCCTTHFQRLQTVTTDMQSRSALRLKSMNRLLQNRFRLSIAEGIELLKDCANGMRYKHSGMSLTNAGTFQSFLFNVTDRTIYISNARQLPVSLHGAYQKIELDKVWQDESPVCIPACEPAYTGMMER